MKICVYAISKNEEKFVDRWYKSMSEADEIYVLDTGSNDKTVEKLKKLGAKVKVKKYDKWRFDVARNDSLDMVPLDTDICVCTDLDEVFNKGWRKNLEKVWKNDTTRLNYIYNWSLDENNKPVVTFYYDKIHSRKNYKWIYPVHEVLKYTGNNKEIYSKCDDIILNHYPDRTKSRSSYLSLLELSVKEDPTNDRHLHYLGREYMYYGRWNEAIDTLIKHIYLKNSTWRDERCASMRFIARCYKNINRFDEARMWLDKAIDEAPYLRDPYMESALLDYQLGDYEKLKDHCLMALSINKHQKTYINEVFSWDNTVYDLLSIAYFNLGNYKESLDNINKALEYDKDNERLLNNKKIVEDVIDKI